MPYVIVGREDGGPCLERADLAAWTAAVGYLKLKCIVEMQLKHFYWYGSRTG